MEVKVKVTGVDKYIAIVGILASKLLETEPFCSLQPKALLLYAHLLYYKNDVYKDLEDSISNQLVFSTETKKKIAESLGIDLVGFSNYTKMLRDKGILESNKKAFNKRFHIPNMDSFTVKFE